MTTYTFNPNASTKTYQWSDPTAWAGGVVPNSADADVVFPTITSSTTGIYQSDITINSGQSYQTNSVTITNNDLVIDGALTIAGSLSLHAGADVEVLGPLSIGALQNDNGSGDIEGTGQITSANAIINTGAIYGGGVPGGLALTFAGFTNYGAIEGYAVVSTSDGNFTNPGSLQDGVTVNAPNGGFTNFSGGTLTGGTYETLYPSTARPISFNVGGLITTDAATIVIVNESDTLQSYDNASGTYLPLDQMLRTIAPTGVLSVGTYATTTLKVQGTLDVAGSFTATQLNVTKVGQVLGNGTITGSIADNGLVEVTSYTLPNATSAPSTNLVIKGDVTGTGTLEVGPAVIDNSNYYAPSYIGRTLELAGAVSTKVTFADKYGTVIIDKPAAFTGSITPSGFGSTVDLYGIGLSSITSYSYAGNSSGGTLTLNQGTTSTQLHFNGNYSTASFVLSAGPQALSNSTPSLDITEKDVEYGTSFVVDGSTGTQTLIGTGSLNTIDVSNAYGGDYGGFDSLYAVAVDLNAGTVTKYGNKDAILSNIQAVKLGSDSAGVTGLKSGTDYVYSGTGPLTFIGQGANDVIQASSGSIMLAVGESAAITGGADTVSAGANDLEYLSGTNGVADVVNANDDKGTTTLGQAAAIQLADNTQANITGANNTILLGTGDSAAVNGGGNTVAAGANDLEYLYSTNGFADLVSAIGDQGTTAAGQTAGIHLGDATQANITGIGNAIVLGTGDSAAVNGGGNTVSAGANDLEYLYGTNGFADLVNAIGDGGTTAANQPAAIQLADSTQANVTGAGNAIVLGTGDSAAVNGGGNSIFAGADDLEYLFGTNGVADTVNANGDGGTTAVGQPAAIQLANNTQANVSGANNTIVLGTGDSLAVNGGGNAVSAGANDLEYLFGTNGVVDTVNANGDQGTTAVGQTAAIQLADNTQANVTGANNTIALGSGDVLSIYGLGNTIGVHGANDTINATGNETVQFGAPGFGNVTFNGFAAGDVFSLSSSIFPNYAALSMHVTGTSSAVITDAASDTLTLTGVAPSSVNASMFKFV